ncbi:unnamed protein product [Parnassius mnemosyne]|uniref:Uncharacterized protein n=2 Tax=Parnassius mnemosyne TaxID=213953 RepID=A0AAV1KZU9_9NEOP
MWISGDDHSHDQPGAPLVRWSTNSEIVAMDGVNLATSTAAPNVGNLSVTKSSRVHIGPKFVSVTQNLQNTEVVKDMPFPVYVWYIMKNSSRAEKLCCLVALLVLITCVTLIVFFAVQATNNPEDYIDIDPHEWNISREMWLAQNFSGIATTERFDPLRLVIIQHTVSPECPRFVLCAAELRTMQSWYIKYYNYDIPYNFIIGNDGRVYEGRGWGKPGAHALIYNRCSLGIGFIGDYREELTAHSRVTELQIKRAKMLLEEGVKRGFLDMDYSVLGAKDLIETASPGSNLYNAIREWEHYDHSNKWRNKTCEEMYGFPPVS